MQAEGEQTMEGQDVAPRDRKVANSIVPPALVVLVLWSAFLLDGTYAFNLARWGILPRTLIGLRGVLFSPFIHGDMEHLLNNSIPILVLGSALLYFFPRLAGRVVLASWIISGTWVWISARDNYHIGASGVVYGIAAFLFTSGLLRKQRTLMGLSLLVVFLYGGLIWGVFPIVPRISWESHFWGAAAGVIMAFLYRNVPSAVRDPKPPIWDEEEDVPGADPANGPPVDQDPSSGDADVQGSRSWRSTDTWSNGGPEK